MGLIEQLDNIERYREIRTDEELNAINESCEQLFESLVAMYPLTWWFLNRQGTHY